MKSMLGLLATTAIAVVMAAPALAGSVDENLDPQIFVQDSGTAPAGGDPNILTNAASGFVIGVAGSATLQNPLLVIVGVYDGSGVPTLTFAPGVSTALVGTYGLTAATATFNAASVGSAYDQVGLTSGGSESFVNWSAGDVAAGFAAPTFFTEYVFALNAALVGGSPITVQESGAAGGSFIIAYDCKLGASTSPDCNPNGAIGETPFTNAGLITDEPCIPGTPGCVVNPPIDVPEPRSIMLLGTFGAASLFAGMFGRLRRRNGDAA